jgi:hypothetical protein
MPLQRFCRAVGNLLDRAAFMVMRWADKAVTGIPSAENNVSAPLPNCSTMTMTLKVTTKTNEHTGEGYARISFEDLYERLCSALRGNRAPVIAELLKPDGSRQIFRARRPK